MSQLPSAKVVTFSVNVGGIAYVPPTRRLHHAYVAAYVAAYVIPPESAKTTPEMIACPDILQNAGSGLLAQRRGKG